MHISGLCGLSLVMTSQIAVELRVFLLMARDAEIHLELHSGQTVHGRHINVTPQAIDLRHYVRLMPELHEIRHEVRRGPMGPGPFCPDARFSFTICGCIGIMYLWQKKHFSTSGSPACSDLST